MSIKATLFACVIAAAAAGCRNDRNSREQPYSRTVESPEEGARNTLRTDEAGHTVHETTTPSSAGVEPLNDDSDTSSLPTRDSTGANVSSPGTGQGAGAMPAPSTTGTSAIDTAAQSHHTSRDAGISRTMKTGERGTMSGSTGVSETASGNGTTTNTGTNSENQGTGGTDDPTR